MEEWDGAGGKAETQGQARLVWGLLSAAEVPDDCTSFSTKVPVS